MWAGLFLVCFVSAECLEVTELEVKHYFTKQECEKKAVEFAKNLHMKLLEAGHLTQVGYRCEESKKIHGTKFN
jgi:hypothetical protein